MAPSSTSRVPVELWQGILRLIILELEILNPDPYDVPPSKLLTRAAYLRGQDRFPPIMSDERYRNFISQITSLRLVCKGWDNFARPFLDCVISLSYDGADAFGRNVDSKMVSRAIKMIRTSFPPRCPCQFGELCSQCGFRRGGTHRLIVIDNSTTMRMARSIDYVDDSTLTILLDSAAPFANLRGLSFFWERSRLDKIQPFPSSIIKEIPIQMPNLVYLEISIMGIAPDPIPLDFPRLESLDVICHHYRGFSTIRQWKLPSLKSFLSRLPSRDAQETIDILKGNAPNLTFLSFHTPPRLEPNQTSNIWTALPYLIALRSSLAFLLANPPPPTHPLQHFMIGEHLVDSFGTLASDVPVAVKGWAKCQTVLVEGFQWIDAFRAVYKFNRAGLEKEYIIPLTSTAATAYLRVGLELEELGVRFEDMYGLSFAEACDRFSPVDTREALGIYVDLADVGPA